MMYRILIVDDDVHISKLLTDTLTHEGYITDTAFSGTEALLVLNKNRPDLILLDLMLPGLCGEELLPKIKDIPVIVVSAKADVTDKIGLLLGGAVDYVTKPFNIHELLARIAVQLRKKNTDNRTISCKNITLYPDKLTVVIDKTEIHLTRTECAILKLLMQDPDMPVGKITILDNISYDTPDCTERSLRQHISNIRHKLQAADGKDHIEAVYGIGFKMKF